jgi:hypothetical protein
MKWPALDRRYFMMLGQAYNDISILALLMVANFHRGGEARPLMARKTTTALMCIRLLAGRIWEMHKLIDGKFNRFVQDHADRAPDGRATVARFRQYLAAPNAVRVVRLNAAFHYDQDLIDAGLERFDDDQLTDYISDAAGNCTFDGADTLLLLGLGRELEQVWGCTTPLPPGEVLTRLILEVRDASQLALDVAMRLQRAVYDRHLPSALQAAAEKAVLLPDQPDASELHATAFLYSPPDQRREIDARRQKARLVAAYSYGKDVSPWERAIRTKAAPDEPERPR